MLRRVKVAPSLVGGAALVVLALAALWPAMHGAFVFDDTPYIARNRLVLGDDGLRRLWTTTESGDFWPLSYTVFWLEWRLFGGNTLGYHLVNAGLHAGTSWMLWRIVAALRFLPRGGAWLVAALFCLHPVNVETAAWIFQTKTTLAAFLGLAAALAYLGSVELGGKGRYTAALGLFIMALLAKSSMVTLPLAAVLYGVAVPNTDRRRLLLRVLPFLAVGALLAGADLWVTSLHPVESEAVRGDGALSRFCAAARAVWFYLGKDLLPTGLGFVYPRWQLGVGWSRALPVATMAAVLAGLWRGRRTPVGRASLVALVAFILLLLPCLGFVNISFMRHSYVADHWQYPAIAVPVAWFVWMASHLGKAVQRAFPAARGSASRRLTGMTAALALPALAVCAVLSHQRADAFADERSFWTAALAANPQSGLARLSLAALSDEQGQVDVARREYSAIIAQNAGDEAERSLVGSAHYSLGALLAKAGERDAALVEYRQAAAMLAYIPEIQEHLASLLVDAGRIDEAVAAWREAVRLAPRSALAQAGLGLALRRHGEPVAAAQALAAAVQIEPEVAEYRANLGLVLLEQGDLAQADRQLGEALRLAPEGPGALEMGCRLRGAQGRLAEALDLARHAQRIVSAQGQTEHAAMLAGEIARLQARLDAPSATGLQAITPSRSGRETGPLLHP